MQPGPLSSDRTATGPLRRLLAAALAILACGLCGCASPRLDHPDAVRRTETFLPPLFTSAVSPDGTSREWSALVWLVGAETEGDRQHARALPFWWHDRHPPYSSNTLLFPFWYERTTPESRTRFASLLYGFQETPELRTDYVLPPLFWWQRSRTADESRHGLFLLWDRRQIGPRDDRTLLPILGLAHLARLEAGFPAEGVQVGALGRSASRRLSVLNLLSVVELFGYDDVGDTREWRLLTLLGSEVLSPVRSWRGRGELPFVREWIFPLYMNLRDADGGWAFVGPLWGEWHDAERGTRTDWYAAGLLSRSRSPAPDGELRSRWRLLGLPLSGD